MRILKTLPIAAVLLGGCIDLDVSNPNEPDRDRVLNRPEDIETLIAGTYRQYFDQVQENYPNLPLAAMADNATGGFFDFSLHDLSTEPRAAWNNSSLNTRDGVNEDPWYTMYAIISSVNDGLRALDGGAVIPGQNANARAYAFGRFVQGIAHGYLALHFDQALIIDVDTDLEQLDPTGFRPYTEVRDAALEMLDDAADIAGSSTFSIPGTVDWINGVPLTNAELVRVIRSYQARIIAYSGRTWEERNSADWNRVIQLVDAGIQSDLAPEGLLDVWESNMRRLWARVRTLPGDHARMDYFAVGPADVSGQFQTWFATPSDNRMPFQLTSPDRRIQGAGGVNSNGTYVGYSANTIWPAARGTYRFSWYYYLRSGQGESWYLGRQPTMTVAEMDLLGAEALIRTNRAADAVPLINRTRVANGQLAPVTVDGPPDDAQCVPRKTTGGCGSLWDALRYEKTLELAGIEGAISWWDARGWGTLQEGTLVHVPVPGREIDNLGIANYTFGGGGEGSAPAPQYHRCPVALARC
jgi:hypothetical protein